MFIFLLQDYNRHLFSDAHRLTLQRVSLKLKHQLLKMRTAQRDAQREADQGEEEEAGEAARSAFCLLCRLNHRQSKTVHNASDGHKNMIRFQRPKCSICRIYFKSPFMYEQHRCSLEHIRLKAKSDNLRTDDENSDGEVERDLENFTTVDSVGEVDDEDASEMAGAEKAGGQQEEQEDDINIGIEHVNKIEVHYCDLCRYHFPTRDDIDTRIKRHCQSRAHLRAYLEFKDDELLRQDAERLARKKKQAPKKVAEQKKKNEEGEVVLEKAEGQGTAEASTDVEMKHENGDVAVPASAKADGEGEKEKEGGDDRVDKQKEVENGKEGEKKKVENGKNDQEDGDELELTAVDEIAQDEDQDVSDMLDRSNYEDDEDSRVNSER